MSKKIDRRVRRTRRLLGEAVLALMLEKEYDAITIQDITEQADLNRATFYLHYNSKEELLVDALEQQFDELVEGIDQAANDATLWQDQTPELLTFQYVANHAELYKVLLGERGNGYIVHRIIEYIARITEADIDRCLPAEGELSVPGAIVARHVAGSLYALLSWWVLNDMPYPAEYMADITHKLGMQGAANFLPQPGEEPSTDAQAL